MRACVALLALLVAASPIVAGTTRHNLSYSNNEEINKALDQIDRRLPFTGQPAHNVIFCGQLANAGTIYLGPANVGDATGEAGEGASPAAAAGGAACNALDSATEATADAPAYTNLPMRITGMYCKAVADAGTTGSGTNGVVFTLRSAAADLAPTLTCTVPTASIECIATPTTSTAVVGAGATLAVKAVSTEDLSTMDGWCRVFYSVN